MPCTLPELPVDDVCLQTHKRFLIMVIRRWQQNIIKQTVMKISAFAGLPL